MRTILLCNTEGCVYYKLSVMPSKLSKHKLENRNNGTLSYQRICLQQSKVQHFNYFIFKSNKLWK